ncbi:MAG: DNA-3-methyladenine glycosylase I [Spirochaetes bacterium]|nr:MAG: DNA-3-methyladenine glycosylase I [Spirochaetota bacterium]
MERCPWCGTDPLYVRYHDEEWGSPVHDDRRHFEFLLLETQQAGLSWITILRKRQAYREAFSEFDPEKVACYGEAEVLALLQNPGIIRNRRKIEATIKNARAFLAIQKEFGSFDSWIWGFVDGVPLKNRWTGMRQIPITTELSDLVSAQLKKRGFSFVGSTTIYAHLQAIGVVDDHLLSCFRRSHTEGGH